MTAHRHHAGFMDRPIHPVVGVTMFAVGMVAFWVAAVYVAAWLFG